MKLAGLTFNFINVVAVPSILGIGIDDGVHVLHRYLREGRGRLPEVMASTGKAILLTSLTTMLAFGSLVGSSYMGYVYFGAVMFIGVGLCFVTSAFVLPAILALVYEKGGKA
jgi:predicted RND superfamily exporter protein